MYILITIILMILEILVIIGLVKLLFIVTDLKKKIPDVQKMILSDIVTIREELKTINSKLEIKHVKPFNNQELGAIFGKTIMKLILFRRFPLPQFLILLFKHKKRLSATFFS